MGKAMDWSMVKQILASKTFYNCFKINFPKKLLDGNYRDFQNFKLPPFTFSIIVVRQIHMMKS